MTVKRSVSIRGHQTSISIEDAFWREFQEIAMVGNATVAGLIARIDGERAADVNLSSAIRLFVLQHLLDRLGAADRGGRVSTESETQRVADPGQ